MKTNTENGSRDPQRPRLALVAHDNKKPALLDWAGSHLRELAACELWATGTTGGMLIDELGLAVTRLHSGPMGGDQQIGAMIAEGRIDMLVFFWDPLEPQPHDPDVRALLRIAAVWDLPVACNRSTADLLMASPLLSDRLSSPVTASR
ncbi:MAG: methylglyoxal synthase [Actinobacteria bacterium]|nr:methylglyoxal synthase [Actinomycetota bacterium]MTA77855.1 methylglyoxal synthase [Actinomycetota bacterium]